MHILKTLLLFFSVISPAFSASTFDYSSPEKALTTLERAFVEKDIEGAVKSKAFRKEAEVMLLERFKGKVTEEMIASITRSLELSFRLEIQKKGFPNFAILKCSSEHKLLSPGVAVLTERCVFPDRGHSIQRVKAYQMGSEWKIGEPLD